MKIWTLITILIIFSLCISSTPETTTPKTTSEPTTLPPTTLAPVNEEENALEEIDLPEYLIKKISGLDTDTDIDKIELYIENKAKEFLGSGMSEEITGKLLIDIAHELGALRTGV